MERALSFISGVWGVGITEFFWESVCMLEANYKAAFPERCDCQLHQPDVKLFPRRVSPEEVQMAHSLTGSDSVLYKHALKRFSADIASVEQRFSVQLLCPHRKRLLEKLSADEDGAAAGIVKEGKSETPDDVRIWLQRHNEE